MVIRALVAFAGASLVLGEGGLVVLGFVVETGGTAVVVLLSVAELVDTGGAVVELPASVEFGASVVAFVTVGAGEVTAAGDDVSVGGIGVATEGKPKKMSSMYTSAPSASSAVASTMI